MKYKHLRIEEREKIQELFWQKKSVRYIAGVLNRSPASISRELRRNLRRLQKIRTDISICIMILQEVAE